MTLPESIGVYRYDSKGVIEVRPPSRNEIPLDQYWSYWWVKELKEIFRGFPKWYELFEETAQKKLLGLLTEDQIVRLTLFRLKERYMEESDTLKQCVLRGEHFEKRKFQKKINVTPLKDIPAGELLGV